VEVVEWPASSVPHLSDPFWHDQAAASASVPHDTLPYSDLSSQAFERLCFRLLLIEGKLPSFWGRPYFGAQQGIDLICYDGQSCTVYQCKRVANVRPGEIAEWLTTFETEYLRSRVPPAEEAHGLPRPKTFVLYCACTVNLTPRMTEEIDGFTRRTAIPVQIVSRAVLDELLRRKPDVVSDTFGARVAQAFCAADDWRQALFVPAAPPPRDTFNVARDPAVDRYLELTATDRVVVDRRRLGKFSETLTNKGLVLLLGAPGTGKTTAALSYAERSRSPRPRVYLIRDWLHAPIESVVLGIVDRARSWVSIFVLDDVHRDLDKADRIVRTLQSPSAPPLQIVMTARGTGADFPAVHGADRNNVIQRCVADGDVIVMETDDAFLRELVEKHAPEAAVVSGLHLKLLRAATSGNLRLVDQALSQIADEATFDALDGDQLFAGFLNQCFGTVYVHEPSLQNIAALAQFEITVLRSTVDIAAVTRESLKGVVRVEGRPAAYRFAHASLAELLFVSLCYASDVPNREELAARAIVDHIQLLEPSAREHTLSLVVGAQLSLLSAPDIAIAVLSDQTIMGMICSEGARDSLLIARALTLLAAVPADSPISAAYREAALRRVRALIDAGYPDDIRTIGALLSALYGTDGPEVDRLVEAMNIQTWLQPPVTFDDVFFLLQGAVDSFADKLLDGIGVDDVAQRLVDTTARSPRPAAFRTWHLRYGKLRARTASGRTRFERMLDSLDPAIFADLLARAGTLADVATLVRVAPTRYTNALNRSLGPDGMRRIVDRTGDVRLPLSLLTLYIAAWRDGRTVSLPRLLQFETNLRPSDVIRLLRKRGTIMDFLRWLTVFTPDFARKMIGVLTRRDVDDLVKAAIVQRRSLEDLGALIAFGASLTNNMPAPRLQSRLTVYSTLQLLSGAGSIVDFVSVLQSVDTQYGTALLRAVTPSVLRTLVAAAPSRGKSISTVAPALRRMKQTRPAVRLQLDKIMFPDLWWELFFAAGDIADVSSFLAGRNVRYAQNFLGAAAGRPARDWLELVSRSDFSSVCGFVRYFLSATPDTVRHIILPALERDGRTLCESATIEDVGKGLGLLRSFVQSGIAPQPVVRGLFDPALERVRLDVSRRGPYRRLADAAGFLHTVMTTVPEVVEDVGRRLWQIVPNEETWSTERRPLQPLRFLAMFCQSRAVPQLAAERTLRAIAGAVALGPDTPTSPRLAFLFVWNVYALWFERGRRVNADFQSLFTPAFKSWLVELLRECVREERTAEGRVTCYALAGTIAYALPSLRERCRVRIPRIRTEELSAVEEMTFVPAFFATYGLETYGNVPAATLGALRQAISTKHTAYAQVGLAVRSLVERV
jgi:hypothetical protein